MTVDTALASMTGYGSASAESERYRVTVRMRSVNHRNLDLAVKVPESYRHRSEREPYSEFIERITQPSQIEHHAYDSLHLPSDEAVE